jgi:hypothetical protein
MILGASAIIEAFAAQFRDPEFRTYVRETGLVELDRECERAAETGRWTADWASRRMSGVYLACWRKQSGQWAIESELFVTLA